MAAKQTREEIINAALIKLNIINDQTLVDEFNIIFSTLSDKEIRSRMYKSAFQDFLSGGVENLSARILKYYSLPTYAVTKEKLILRHGEIQGVIKWNEYVEKQRVSNTFDYKAKKYGMTKLEFQEYNSSRSITKENMILRHGEIQGVIKWNEYVEKQKTAGVKLSYFIEKYGEIDGKIKYEELNKQKAINLNNFIRKYGTSLGNEKFLDYISSRSSVACVSKISQDFCKNLEKMIKSNNINVGHIYYHDKNMEFGKMSDSGSYFKYDFVDTESKVAIEFNGDYWHGNPKKYKETNTIRGIVVKDLWDKDIIKIRLLESYGFKVIVVWENDYRLDKHNTLLKAFYELYGIK